MTTNYRNSCGLCLEWNKKWRSILLNKKKNEKEQFHLWVNDNESISSKFTTQFSLLKCSKRLLWAVTLEKYWCIHLHFLNLHIRNPFSFSSFFFFFWFSYFAVYRHIQHFCHFTTLVLCNHHLRWTLSIVHDHQHFPKITFHINEASFSLFFFLFAFLFICYLRVCPHRIYIKRQTKSVERKEKI